MRIYIIGNDGITLCRETPVAVNEGEIAVASVAELRAAPLSAKRLLALWNALPGVEKRKKVGDRDALIDQLWSAIEMLPDPEPQPDLKRPSKQDVPRCLATAISVGAFIRRWEPCDAICAANGPSGRASAHPILHGSFASAISPRTSSKTFSTAASPAI
jgi:hypothetical protein